MSLPLIGVLALQGAFNKHFEMLKSLNCSVCLVKRAQELEYCDGLIIPGGESTTIIRQMKCTGLVEPLKEFAKSRPVFGTCAGMILMSSLIEDQKDNSFEPLGIMAIEVSRNAYGSQLDSFSTSLPIHFPIDLKTFQNSCSSYYNKNFEAIFIRAPKIESCTSEVLILAEVERSGQKTPVLVQQGKHLAASFHPELSSSNLIHKYFLESCVVKNKQELMVGCKV